MPGPDVRSSGRIFGVVVGIVTNNQDPDGMGRLRVRFPWRDADEESYWARVATMMAGNGRGSWFLPEVDDEVLVAFDHGDIHHPYVIGSLWNGQDAPPQTNSDGENNIREIKSRAGHEFILDDTQAAEKVVIKTKGGHVITLDDTAGGEKIEIIDKTGSNKIVIDSMQNSISLESAMMLKIKSTQIEISADAAMTIKAGAALTLQGAVIKIN